MIPQFLAFFVRDMGFERYLVAVVVEIFVAAVEHGACDCGFEYGGERRFREEGFEHFLI
jgi:hypothetical protein